MAASIREIVTFINYKENEAQIGVFKTLSEQPGFLSLFYGTTLADTTQGVIVIEWKTVEDHMNLVNSEVYGPFRERVAEFADQQTMVHAPINVQSRDRVFDTNVTELIKVTLKPGAASPKQLVADLKRIEETLRARKGCLGAASAQTVEDEKEHVLFSGWESLEALQDASVEEEVDKIFGELEMIADFQRIQISFKRGA